MIEELVVLARVDEMKQVDLAEVDLAEIVRTTAEPFRSVVETAGNRFCMDVPSALTVRGEKRGLAEIVTILVDNAAKYCDESGEVSVRLEEAQGGGHLRNKAYSASLTVANTYVAGADVDYSKFFERFYRADESHNSSKEGFGIGLSMAREIASRMGGKLEVLYAGDTISFRLLV